MSKPAIVVENLSKSYRLGLRERQHQSFRDVITGAVMAPIRRLREMGENGTEQDTFWALKNINFEVQPGEVIGIVGRNGAGKSTLLKVLSRIVEPTSGRIRLRGRLASLLEVGTGFHPELSGRENIYMNGSILGMRKAEIDRKFDEIVAFAEVEKFLDTPVKRYSSGMYVRLAFAVAAYLEPEILIVDEVLAVGDAEFQKKCLGKMQEVSNGGGRTVLFVSHNMAAVRQLTKRCVLLQSGQVRLIGTTDEVLQEYMLDAALAAKSVYESADMQRNYRECSRVVEFAKLSLASHANKLIPAGADITVKAWLKGRETIDRFRISATVFRVDGTAVGNFFGHETLSIRAGELGEFDIHLNDLRLAPGLYCCALALGQGNHLTRRTEFDIVSDVLHFEITSPPNRDGIVAQWPQGWGAIQFPSPQVTKVTSFATAI